MIRSEAVMNATQLPADSLPSSQLELTYRLRSLSKRFLFAALLLLPIPFGAVHEEFYLPFSLLLTSITALVLLRSPGATASLYLGKYGRGTQTAVICLTLTICYAIVQYLVFSQITTEHPVLGMIGSQTDPAVLVTGLRELINFLCAFILTRLYVGNSTRSATALTRIIILAGACVSFIALSHWFYDNGSLFWVFEPETVGILNRARWPFVNPNHLGDYMAACALITLGSVLGLFRRLFDHELTRGRRRNRSVAALIGSEDFHIKVLKPMILSIPLLTMTLALLASQSRGGWLGASIGLVTYAFLSAYGSSRPHGEDPRVISLEQHKRSRRHRHGRSTSALRMDGSWAMLFVEGVERFAKPLCLLGSTLIVLFFLNSKGRELVAGRLEFGLLSSMEDIRWTYYSNSWNMLLEHPLFGVGLGGWASHYARYSAPQLAGLNPVYLHSDPLQLLIELGIIGVLPMIALAFSTVVIGLKAIRGTQMTSQRLPLISLMSALVALAVSTLPEFPLRIPAISFSLAVWLALFISRSEQRLHEIRSPLSPEL